MKKRGQISSETFVYILTIFIVGVILVIGYKYISGNKNIVDKSELLQLQSKLASDIGLVAKDYGTFKKVTYALPQNLNEVCFLDLSKKDDILSSKLIGFYPLIKDSLASNLNKNVFFVGGAAQQAIQIANIKLNHYPYINCFHAKNNKIEVGIEGLGGGNSLILADFVTQAKISKNSNTVLKSADELITIDVPQGTEGADTISIEMVSPSTASSSSEASDVYKFGPSGTRFSKPVGLTMKYNPNIVGECPQKLTFYQYNDDGSLEAAVPSKAIDCKNKIVVFEINGFSLGVLGVSNSAPNMNVNTLGSSTAAGTTCPKGGYSKLGCDREGFPIGSNTAYSLGTNARGVDLAQLMDQFLFPRIGIPAGDPEGVWVPSNPLQKCVTSVINSYTASTPTASQTVADLFDLIVQKCSSSSTLTGGDDGVTCKSGVNTFEVSSPCGTIGSSCSSNSYSAASFKCYDGFSQHLDSTSCKNTDAWLQLAEDACFGHTSCTNGSNSSTPVCGDGIINAGETCDDGNTINGDGCSATCQIEVSPPPPIPETATVPCDLKTSQLFSTSGASGVPYFYDLINKYLFPNSANGGYTRHTLCPIYLIKKGVSFQYKVVTGTQWPSVVSSTRVSIQVPSGVTITGAHGTKLIVQPALLPKEVGQTVALPTPVVSGNTATWSLPDADSYSRHYQFFVDASVAADAPLSAGPLVMKVFLNNVLQQTVTYGQIIGAPLTVGNIGGSITAKGSFPLPADLGTPYDGKTQFLPQPNSYVYYFYNDHIVTGQSQAKTYMFSTKPCYERVDYPCTLARLTNAKVTVEIPKGVTITGAHASQRNIDSYLICPDVPITVIPTISGNTVTWSGLSVPLTYSGGRGCGLLYGPILKFYVDTRGAPALVNGIVKWHVDSDQGTQDSAFSQVIGAPSGTEDLVKI